MYSPCLSCVFYIWTKKSRANKGSMPAMFLNVIMLPEVYANSRNALRPVSFGLVSLLGRRSACFFCFKAQRLET